MNRYIIISFLSCLAFCSLGQDCTQQLESAQRAYYDGQLKAVISKLESCVGSNHLTTLEMEAVLRLLINSHLILKEDSVANIYMNKLLTISPLTEAKSSDLVEFQRLHASYNIRPKRSFGFTLGVSDPDFRTLQYRSLGAITKENNDYNTKPGVILGFKLDQYLTKNIFASSGV